MSQEVSHDNPHDDTMLDGVNDSPHNNERSQLPPSVDTMDLSALRGDAVGSTAYSERWVLSLMMRLVQVTPDQWDSDLETAVCLLWDMCVEEDIVQLLAHHDMLGLATHIIVNFDEPRVIELMVGILGNMCAVQSVRNELGRRPALIEMLMGMLSFHDTPTLVQLLRLLQLCAWHVKEQLGMLADNMDVQKVKQGTDEVELKCLEQAEKVNSELHVNDTTDSNDNRVSSENKDAGGCTNENKIQSSTYCDKEMLCWLEQFQHVEQWLTNITFILKSSKCEELLHHTLSFLDTVCYIPLEESYLSRAIAESENVVYSLLESYKEWFSNRSEHLEKTAIHWVSVIYSFTLHSQGITALCEHKISVIESLFGILQYCLKGPEVLLDNGDTTCVTLPLAILEVLLTVEPDPHDVIVLHTQLHSLVKLWMELLTGFRSVEEAYDGDTHVQDDVKKAMESYFAAVKEWLDPRLNEEHLRILLPLHKQLCQLLMSV